jgi:Asp/Glu/hydantoin racemase
VRIGLIHAVAVAIAPVEEAFRRLWPGAELASLLDDRLSVDRAKHDELTAEMFARVRRLAAYQADIGAAGLLYTCSAFGAAIEAVARDYEMPVLKPNEAMFEAALAHGSRIGMLATFERSVASMEEELRSQAAGEGREVCVETVCVPEAMAALQAGDDTTHNRLLAEAAGHFDGIDALMLAQFSTSIARHAVADVVACPVLTSPDSAVLKLKGLLQPDL